MSVTVSEQVFELSKGVLFLITSHSLVNCLPSYHQFEGSGVHAHGEAIVGGKKAATSEATLYFHISLTACAIELCLWNRNVISFTSVLLFFFFFFFFFFRSKHFEIVIFMQIMNLGLGANLKLARNWLSFNIHAI